MPRRINFTGRRKIRRSDVSIRIVEQNGGIEFIADLLLGEYKLDPSARVHIEAFRSDSTLWKRFNFGTIGDFGPQNGCALDDFGHPDGIRFRVKISSGSDFLGRLVAEADGIRPELPDEHDQHHDPILDVAPGAMGSELRVESHDAALAGCRNLHMESRSHAVCIVPRVRVRPLKEFDTQHRWVVLLWHLTQIPGATGLRAYDQIWTLLQAATKAIP
jgi:hypothetical protein